MNEEKITAKDLKQFIDDFEWLPEDMPFIVEIKRRIFSNAPIRFYRLCDNADCEFCHKGFCSRIKKECNYDYEEPEMLFGKEVKHVGTTESAEYQDQLALCKCMLKHLSEKYQTSVKHREQLEAYAKECEKDALKIKEEFDALVNKKTVEQDKPYASTWSKIYKDWFDLFGDKTPKSVSLEIKKLKDTIGSFEGQKTQISNMQKRINTLEKMLEEKSEECDQLKQQLKNQ